MRETILRRYSGDTSHGVYRYAIKGFDVGLIFPNEFSPIGGIAIAPRKQKSGNDLADFSGVHNFQQTLAEWVQVLYPPEIVKKILSDGRGEPEAKQQRLEALKGFLVGINGKSLRSISESGSIVVSYLLDGENKIMASAVATAVYDGREAPSTYRGFFADSSHITGCVVKPNGDIDYHVEGSLTEELKKLIRKEFGKQLRAIGVEVPVMGRTTDERWESLKDVIVIKPAESLDALLT